MTTSLTELVQGEWIVHSRYGLGQVICQEEKSLSGQMQIYYNVKTGDFNYWLSVSNLGSGRVRPIACSSDFSQALALIGEEPVLLDENYHNRLQCINALLAENSILSKAQLIRDIHARNVRKDIHANERGILEALKIQFIDECILACQMSEQDARDQLQDALKKSCTNIKPKKPAFT